MTRARLVSTAAADVRQVAAFDTTPLSVELLTIAEQAIGAALVDPAYLALDVDGIAPLERETADLIFAELVIATWPQIVKAYMRGAGGEAEKLPTAEALRKLDRDGLVELLAALGLAGIRETLHGQAWALATRFAAAARRARALAAVAARRGEA